MRAVRYSGICRVSISTQAECPKRGRLRSILYRAEIGRSGWKTHPQRGHPIGQSAVDRPWVTKSLLAVGGLLPISKLLTKKSTCGFISDDTKRDLAG